MLKTDKIRVLAPKKRLSRGFHSLYELLDHVVVCILAWFVIVVVLH